MDAAQVNDLYAHYDLASLEYNPSKGRFENNYLEKDSDHEEWFINRDQLRDILIDLQTGALSLEDLRCMPVGHDLYDFWEVAVVFQTDLPISMMEEEDGGE